MSQVFADSINSNPIYATRAESDKDGNQIDLTYAKKSSLATVATSGSYNDLSNKPNLATVATTGSYTDLTNKPNLATVATTGSYNDLSNTPNLATVATSGSYSDLTNKPNLAAVATSGSYNDLTNKPTIPAAQVNSDWDASSGVTAISNKPTFENEADSTTAFDANTPIVVGYNSTSKKLITRLVSALMSFLGISVSGNTKSFSGTADTADNVNSDTIQYAPNGAYVPVIYNNGKRLKVVAGANGLILQKAADSDISLINCKSALAADADHAANSEKVSNHTVGTDVPADAKFIEYVTAANTFDEIKAIVNAGHEPVLKVESSSGGVSHKLRLPLVYFETGTMSAQVARFSGTHGDKIYTYTLMAGSWSTETTTVPAALSAGNGVDITSNTVSVKTKTGGDIAIDPTDGLYVLKREVAFTESAGTITTKSQNFTTLYLWAYNGNWIDARLQHSTYGTLYTSDVKVSGSSQTGEVEFTFHYCKAGAVDVNFEHIIRVIVQSSTTYYRDEVLAPLAPYFTYVYGSSSGTWTTTTYINKKACTLSDFVSACNNVGPGLGAEGARPFGIVKWNDGSVTHLNISYVYTQNNKLNVEFSAAIRDFLATPSATNMLIHAVVNTDGITLDGHNI